MSEAKRTGLSSSVRAIWDSAGMLVVFLFLFVVLSVCVDNFFTSQKSNVAHLLARENFELVRHDVIDPFKIDFAAVTKVMSNAPSCSALRSGVPSFIFRTSGVPPSFTVQRPTFVVCVYAMAFSP